MIDKYKVNQGGLMRCCLQSLDEEMQKLEVEPEPGSIILCKWCGDPRGMIRSPDGVWRWNRPIFGLLHSK